MLGWVMVESCVAYAKLIDELLLANWQLRWKMFGLTRFPGLDKLIIHPRAVHLEENCRSYSLGNDDPRPYTATSKRSVQPVK